MFHNKVYFADDNNFLSPLYKATIWELTYILEYHFFAAGLNRVKVLLLNLYCFFIVT